LRPFWPFGHEAFHLGGLGGGVSVGGAPMIAWPSIR
jgi:hypothetical protein